MIIDIFPTKIIQEDNILSQESLQSIYNFILEYGEDTKIVMTDELLGLSELKSVIFSNATMLVKEYGFTKVTVSDRFSTHFYPAGKETEMETHSDDLGDVGRKFIAFFYLEAEDNAGGELEIFDPRWLNAAWHQKSSSIKIQPKTNKLVIFPTFLWHKVTKYCPKVFPRMAIDVVISVS
jgi:hypothetical protein